MTLRKIIVTVFSFIFISQLHASSPVKNFINHGDWNFVENRGQISDENGNPAPDIKFYGRQGAVGLYCKPGAISFIFTKAVNDVSNVGAHNSEPLHWKQPVSTTMAASRADLILVGSNPNAQIIASEQQSYYENYSLANNPAGNITHVHTYKTITYKDIYPHIDLILHSREKGMKYEFVIYAGGNVNDIQIQWSGLKNLQITENGGITYALPSGTMNESKPVSFQGNALVPSAFAKTGNNIGFNLGGRYDKSQTLVIDPSLSWATYFGGSSADYSNAVATDTLGNVYITGYTTSTSSIATSGAYLTSNAGSDAFLAKFNSAGAEQWATYYGGGNEVGAGVATDNSGNVYITGNTASTSGIATSGAYQTSYGGSIDAFLAKFNSSGALQWGTYYGGSSGDNGYGVGTDGSGNVYITGKTGSSSGIATSGGYQTTFGGSGDAFLAKFNSSGARQWATYYGGSGADAGYGISVSGSVNIYIVGSTASKTGIATSGAYLTSQQGSNDVFLAKFNSAGAEQWATYYGGGSDDEGEGVAVDGSGNVYITGYTGSATGIATSGTYQTAAAGGGTDGFLAGFNSSGARQWGSYYGGVWADYCYGIAADALNNIYITGTTASPKGIATSGAYQSTYYANNDAFLAEFKTNGGIKVGTYYGGRLNDAGTAVAAFNSGSVYITGNTASDTGIATSGAFLSSNAGGANDAFLGKFSFANTNDAGVVSVLNPKGTFCPGMQAVSVKIRNYGLVNLTKANINWSVNSSIQTAYSWTGSVAPGGTTTAAIGSFSFLSGNDTIRAWTTKPNGVADSASANDSAMIVDTANALPAASVIPSTAICSGNSISIGGASVAGHTYSWASSPVGFTSTSANPSVSPLANTIYSLTETITATGCTNTNSDTISLPVANAGSNSTICAGSPVSLGEPSYKGNIYSWTSSPGGFTSTLANPVVSPVVTTTYFFKDSVAGGCSKNGSVVITVNPLPAASVIASTAICPGNSISIGGATVGGHSYSWTSSPSGFSSASSNPSVSPTVSTAYTLTETITATGCSKTSSDTISVPSSVSVSNMTVCAGTSISLGGPAYPGHSYSWTSSPAGFTSTSSNPTISTIFTKTYILKDSVAGCSKTSSVGITVNQLPQATVVTSSAICIGTSVSLGSFNTGGHTYSWVSSPAGFTSTLANPSVKPVVTTIYFLTETVTATGCSKTNSDTISLPHAIAAADTTICPGTSISIGGTSYSGNNYTWTSNPSGFGSTKANPTVKPNFTTTYYLTDAVTAGTKSCTDQDSVVVTVNPAPVATVLASTAICSGSSVSLGTTAVGGHTYSWTSAPAGFTSTASNPSVKPSVNTIYSLTETISKTGCSTTHSDTISMPSSASVITGVPICAGSSISIGGPAYSKNTYSWTSKPVGFTSTLSNPTVTPATTTTYYFKDTVAAGCKKIDSVKITVNPLPAAKTIANSTICAKTPIQIGAALIPGSKYQWTSSPSGFTSTSSNPYVAPTVTTTYYLTETILATGCTQSDSVTITVNPLPSASVIPGTTICSGSISIGAAPVSGNYYSWTSSSGFTSTVSNPSVSPASTTAYTLTEEVLATGCSATHSDTISVPSASVSANTTICSGTAVSIGASTVFNGDTYSWTSSPAGFTSTSANPTVSPSITTTYFLKDSLKGCSKKNSVIVTVNPLPSASVISTTSACVGSAISIGTSATAGHAYSWTSSPSGYTSTLANPSVTISATTTYKLTETVTATGCTNTNSVTITANPLPAASVVANTAICPGGSISVGAASVPGHNYSWTSSPSGFTSTLSNPSVSPTVTTTFILTETITATGCSATHSDTISLPSSTSVHANTAICGGVSVSIGGVSYIGNSYSWTSSPAGFTSTLSNPSVKPATTTKYYLDDSVKGCRIIDSTTVTVSPAPAASVIANTTTCSGSPLSIGAASVSTDKYSWTSSPSGFTSTSSNPSVSPTVKTVYILTEIDTVTGCSKTNSDTITLPVAVVATKSTICAGTSIALGGPSLSGHIYSWTSSPTGFSSTLSSPNVSPSSTTTYTLIDSVPGCSKKASVIITVNPLPAAKVISDSSICSGSPVSIGSSSTAGHSYLWTSSPSGFSSTSSNPSVRPTADTTYTLTETINSTGCKNSNSVKISTNPLPAASIITSTAICSGSISIGGAAVSGDTYSWTSVPTGFTSTSSNPSVSPSVNTSYFLTETITATGCKKKDSVSISLPTISGLHADTTICAGTPVSIGASSAAGNKYSWTSKPSGFTSTLSNPTVSPTTTTTYYFKDSVLNGCSKKDSVKITVNPVPAAYTGPSMAICSGSATIGTTAVTGDKYAWSTYPTSALTATTSSVKVNPTKTTTYILTETIAATGCSKTDTVVISFPVATTISNTTICKGASISIGGKSYTGDMYSWTSSPSGFTSTLANPSVHPTVSTTYFLNDSVSGCKKTGSVTISINPLPAAKVIAGTADCAGGSISIGAAAVTGDTYLWTSLPSGFTSTSANPSVSPTQTTIYTLTETNTAYGCTNTNSDTIFMPVAPVANDTTICGGAPVSIGKNFTPFKGNTYSWTSSPAGFTSTLINPVVKPVVTTTYYFKDTIAGGCGLTNSITVTVKPQPAAKVAASTAICSGSIAIGAAPVAGDTYSWTSLPAGFTSTLSNPTVSPLATTVYSLTETNPTGCSNTHSDTISFASSTSILASTAVCFGNPVSIGGISYPGNSYSWTSSPAGFTSTLANPVVSPTVITTYYLKDSVAGCKKIDSVTLTLKPSPVAKTAANTTICAGTAVSIGATAVGGSTYSWASSPTGFSSTSSNPTVSSVVTTTYYMTETASATGCSKTDSVIVTVNPLPAAAVISNTAICSGAYISIGASPVKGNKYLWTSSPAGFNSVLANPFVAPKVKTTYTLVDTLIASGCANTNSVTITVNPLPVAAIISDTAICSTSFVSIGAKAVAGDNYSWTSSPSGYTSTTSNPSVSPLKATTYYLTETISATGCSKSDSVAISVNPLPAAPVTANTIDCSGFPIFLGDSGVIGDTYSWTSSPSGFTSSIPDPSDKPTVKTTYSLTETITATGCSQTNSITININPLPAAVAGTNSTVCAGSKVSFGATAVTGDKYSWTSVPAGFTSTISNPSTVTNDTTIYYLKETIPATGCYKIDSVEVFAKPSPVANAGKDATICAGNFAPIGVAGISGYKYIWTSSPLGFVSTFAAPSVNPITTTTYVLSDTLTSDKCYKTDSVTITVIPLPAAAQIKNTGICIGDSIAIGAATVNNSSYSWTSVPTGFTSTVSNPKVAPTVTTIYILTETNALTGCSKTDSVTIKVNPLPNAAVIPNSPVCVNSFINIGAAGVAGSAYSWTSSPSGFTSTMANPPVSPTVITTYYLTETTVATGCVKTDSVNLSINPQPSASVAAVSAVCPGTPVHIGAAPVAGDTYSWISSPKGFTSSSSDPIVSPTSTTSYTLTETITATGCSKTNTVTAKVVPFPFATVIPNQAICKGATVYLGAVGAANHTYSWTSTPSGFSSTLSDPEVSPAVNTTYTLTEINNEGGCKASNSVLITIKPYPSATVIPASAICTGSSIYIGAKEDTGSAYLWTSSPSGFVSDSANPVVSPTVSTTYYLTQTFHSTGCSNSNQVPITVNPLPNASVAISTFTCPGSSPVSIGSTPVAGSAYSWTSFPAGFTSTSANPSVNPTVTTTYTLVETNTTTGCKNSNSLTISAYPLPNVYVGKSRPACYQDSIMLGAAPQSGNKYSWSSTPPGFSAANANPVIFPTSTKTYKLTVTSSVGCSKSDSVTITVYPLPDAHWTVITDNKGNASFTADSLKNKSYLWNFGNNYSAITSSPITSYLKSGKYRVTLATKNSYGCTGNFDSVITIHIHTSGISEDSAQTFELSLYPNPFQGATTLQYNLNQSTRVTVELFDMTGKQIGIIEDNTKMEGQYSLNIDAEKYHLTPGIYMLKFITDKGYISRRIIKL